MAKTLSFDKNLVEYDINGDCTVWFNPTDENFVQSLYEVHDEFAKAQTAFNEADGFEAFRNLDKDMRGKIDGLLGDGVADALFGSMNCYALAGGFPVWLNLFVALFDEVAAAYEREFGKTDARVKAHKKKYDAIMAKYRKK